MSAQMAATVSRIWRSSPLGMRSREGFTSRALATHLKRKLQLEALLPVGEAVGAEHLVELAQAVAERLHVHVEGARGVPRVAGVVEPARERLGELRAGAG